MAASVPIHTTIQNPLLKKSSVFHKTHHSFSQSSSHPRTIFTPAAKFQLSEIMGGRGLCNDKAGLKKELKRKIQQDPSPTSQSQPTPSSSAPAFSTNAEAFEKELLGLTGGFPGSEYGLKKFIQENPRPKKTSSSDEEVGFVFQGSKPRAPDLPLLMPGIRTTCTVGLCRGSLMGRQGCCLREGIGTGLLRSSLTSSRGGRRGRPW